MYNNAGYAQDTDRDGCRSDRPIVVNSCGHYRLQSRPDYTTLRPGGRRDYQLLFVAAGRASFGYESPSRMLPEGRIFVYRPGEPQAYRYRLEDHPDIYWLHFTGSEAEDYMAGLLPGPDGRGRSVGIREDYSRLFERIIRELQLGRDGYEPLCGAYAQEMFLLMGRAAREPAGPAASRNRQIEAVIEQMHEELSQNRTVEDYARSCHMGVCWFIRSFRAYTGCSPRQFLIRLKINKARELLSYSSYNIGEVARLTGYDDPLYFSRVFSQTMGCSPSQYRADSGNGETRMDAPLNDKTAVSRQDPSRLVRPSPNG
ncbi:MAG: AraC family transcriptional regulator [Provencibacterium sp.]|jgi:AraC family transcriptional regulator of arabinose operon|nr:AraC family transcriptional regulator [Provencibacterium sp.]